MTTPPPFPVDPQTLRLRLAKMARLGDARRFSVVGRGKSGTTWLARIFRAHRNAELIGERKLLEQTADYTPILRLVADAETMRAWGERSSFKLRLDPGRMGAELVRIVEDYLIACHLIAKEAEQAADPDFDHDSYGPITHIGDKLALNRPEDVASIFPLIKRAYPGIKVVHIVRDGRDVAVSGYFHAYRNRAASEGPGETSLITEKVEAAMDGRLERLFTDPHLTVRARSWNDICVAIDDILSADQGDDYLLLRYEDLLADPAGSARAAFEFVGLDVSRGQVEAAVEGTSFSALAGREAGEMEASSPMRKGIAGDWRNWFTARDRELFAELAQPALERFGYEQDRTWAEPGP